MTDRCDDDAYGRLRGELDDLRAELAATDARATSAARFVRRILASAAGLMIGAIGAAVMMIYQAGEHAAQVRADAAAERARVDHEVELVHAGLTDLRYQVKLLLERDLHR